MVGRGDSICKSSEVVKAEQKIGNTGRDEAGEIVRN